MENLDSETTWLALEYLKGNLSESEMNAVEDRMRTDRAFFILVHDLRQMQKASAQSQDAEASMRAQVAAEAYFADDAPKHEKRRWYVWAASGAAAILTFAAIFYTLRSGSLVDEYFIVEPAEQSLGAGGPERLRLGMNAYAKRDYEKAIGYFESIADTSQDHNTANYFLANAYLASGNTQAALKPLLVLQSIGDQEYQQKRRWLLGLVYIDLGEQAKGRAELQILYDDTTSQFHKDEIKEILGL